MSLRHKLKGKTIAPVISGNAAMDAWVRFALAIAGRAVSTTMSDKSSRVRRRCAHIHMLLGAQDEVKRPAESRRRTRSTS